VPGVGTVVYAYDGLGQRIARRLGGSVTRFIWRGGHVLFETDSAGAILRSYTWGIGDDDLVAITNHQDGNKRYYVVQDLLRSVRGLVERRRTSVRAGRCDCSTAPGAPPFSPTSAWAPQSRGPTVISWRRRDARVGARRGAVAASGR